MSAPSYPDHPACLGAGHRCADCGDELPAPADAPRRCPAKTETDQ